jgi:predicted transcriptional regulator
LSLEVIIGAIGALGSLTAAVVKTVLQKAEKSEDVIVTVQRKDERIEKHGTLRAAEISTVLDMVQDDRSSKAAAK